MKRIDKTTIHSITYKRWEERFEYNAENHEEYSSTNEHYWNVVMNLYHCQNGLCAYTEMDLIGDLELIKLENWNNGQYQLTQNKPFHLGELEHFDSTLKTTKGWLWDNLFMISSTINRRKGTKLIDNILKPDNPNYNPFELLDYDINLHIFFANTNLDEETIQRVNDMIHVLGLNQVKGFRKTYINKRIEKIKKGEEADHVNEYITAYEMTLRNLNLK